MRDESRGDRGARVDHVIAAIDGALDDWATSGDAMRWSPEPPESAPPLLIAGEIDPPSWNPAWGSIVFEFPIGEFQGERISPGAITGSWEIQIPPDLFASLTDSVRQFSLAARRATEPLMSLARALREDRRAEIAVRERALAAHRSRSTGPVQMKWRHRDQ